MRIQLHIPECRIRVDADPIAILAIELVPVGNLIFLAGGSSDPGRNQPDRQENREHFAPGSERGMGRIKSHISLGSRRCKPVKFLRRTAGAAVRELNQPGGVGHIRGHALPRNRGRQIRGDHQPEDRARNSDPRQLNS